MKSKKGIRWIGILCAALLLVCAGMTAANAEEVKNEFDLVEDYDFAWFRFSKDGYVNSEPYDPVDEQTGEHTTVVRNYAKGAYISVLAKYKNSYGNIWYKLTDGTYVYEGRVEQVALAVWTAQEHDYFEAKKEIVLHRIPGVDSKDDVTVEKGAVLEGNSCIAWDYILGIRNDLTHWIGLEQGRYFVKASDVNNLGHFTLAAHEAPRGDIYYLDPIRIKGQLEGTSNITNVTVSILDADTGEVIKGPFIQDQLSTKKIKLEDLDKVNAAALAAETVDVNVDCRCEIMAEMDTGLQLTVLETAFRRVTTAGGTPSTELKITKQPQNRTAAKSGDKVTTKVEAAGDGLSYQWYKKNPGDSKFSKSSVAAATYSDHLDEKYSGRQIYCVVTDQYGNSVKSDTVTLAVAPQKTEEAGYNKEYEVVTPKGLLINKQYNKSGTSIKTMRKGTHFWADMSTAVTAGNYTWAKCRLEDGTEGWVAISNPSFCVPVETETPTPSVTPGADDFLPGDVTGDGTVDIMDVIRLLKHVSGWDVKIVTENSEVTGDNDINIMDVIRLLKYVSGWSVNLE